MLSINNEYYFPVRVYYEDTDALGFVYHSNYFNFAERARTEMLRKLGIGADMLRTTTGIAFVVRHCAADFIQAARLDDDLIVVTNLIALRGASMDFEQRVERAGVVLTKLTVEIACIDRNGRPSRLPSELRLKFLTATA